MFCLNQTLVRHRERTALPTNRATNVRMIPNIPYSFVKRCIFRGTASKFE
jgi:hypothetical protein